jgi:hypothetical protein
MRLANCSSRQKKNWQLSFVLVYSIGLATQHLILRSGVFAASRRKGHSICSPWFETALTRLLTMRGANCSSRQKKNWQLSFDLVYSIGLATQQPHPEERRLRRVSKDGPRRT